MRFKKSYLLPLLFIALLSSQCKKDDDNGGNGSGGGTHGDGTFPPATDTIYVDNELKKYYYFGEGSWWVYKRTDTNAVVYDTATLRLRESRIVYERIDVPIAWEYVFTGVIHSYYDAFSGGPEPKLQVGSANLNKHTDRISMFSEKDLFSNINDFLSVPVDSVLISEKSRERSILIDTDDLTLTNYTFPNTVHIKYGFNANFITEIWITKNVGLTKYFNPGDNTAWELINYEIKP